MSRTGPPGARRPRGLYADPAARWAGRRVLVTRLRYMGDAVLTLPLLAALRHALPASELHFLAEAASLEMLAAQPEIDVRWTAPHGALATVSLARRLRGQRFGAVLDLFCNPRSALLVRATGAPVRVGEDRRVRRHAYTLARHLQPGRSALEQHLDAMRGLHLAVPAPSRPVLAVRAEEMAAGQARWRSQDLLPGVVLHLGASAPTKEWPVEHAAEFVRLLAGAGWPVLLTTAPRRPEPSRELAARCGGQARLLPVLPLREVLGVFAASAAVVSVDGALVHAAVALGRPTIALFGPTDPRVWFPYERFGPYRVLHAGPPGDLAGIAPAAVWGMLQHLTPGRPAASLGGAP